MYAIRKKGKLFGILIQEMMHWIYMYNIVNESLLSGVYYICIFIRITINLVTLTPLQYRQVSLH